MNHNFQRNVQTVNIETYDTQITVQGYLFNQLMGQVSSIRIIDLNSKLLQRYRYWGIFYMAVITFGEKKKRKNIY